MSMSTSSSSTSTGGSVGEYLPDVAIRAVRTAAYEYADHALPAMLPIKSE